MSLDYRIAPLPAVWPGTMTPSYQRTRAPFKTIETKALALLEREIRMLGGKNVEIAVDVEPHQVRRDGMLYANSRPKSPAVIVSFDTARGRLAFPCDTFGFFWANVDAIARALEDLRRIDRARRGSVRDRDRGGRLCGGLRGARDDTGRDRVALDRAALRRGRKSLMPVEHRAAPAAAGSRPPGASRVSLDVAYAVEPMDADLWVRTYIRLLMRLEGARSSADAIREAS